MCRRAWSAPRGTRRRAGWSRSRSPRTSQPCSRRCAAAAPSLTSSPQALPCRLPAASTVSSASTKAGAVMSPGTPRSWLRSRGPMNSTSTPSTAAISSTAATARGGLDLHDRPGSPRRPGPARRDRARTGRPGCRWPPRGPRAAGTAGAVSAWLTCSGTVHAGQHDSRRRRCPAPGPSGSGRRSRPGPRWARRTRRRPGRRRGPAPHRPRRAPDPAAASRTRPRRRPRR